MQVLHSFVYASLAQSVEHAAVNRGVVGSSPTGGAKKVTLQGDFLFSVFFIRRRIIRSVEKIVYTAVIEIGQTD